MSALPCIVSMQIDAHLAQMDRDEGRSLAIEEIELQLQQPGEECDPLDADNFGEAIAGANLAEVVALYRDGDDLAAGFAMRSISERYCKDRAETIAEDRLDAQIRQSQEDFAEAAYEDRQYEANY
jgi:hypothetical protein